MTRSGFVSGGVCPARWAAYALFLTLCPAIALADEARPAGLPAKMLSPWSMFMDADQVVRAVMVGLAFASVVTWTVWLAKTVELFLARRTLARNLAAIAAAQDVPGAIAAVGQGGGPAYALLQAAAEEWRLSADSSHDQDGLKERTVSRLERIEAAAGRRMTQGTGILATIGATAPFVGLFGTVWGIMNSFIGISQSHTTNLAVVAPGIAEALLATACGLVAAIPAVVIYNHFARAVTAYRALTADTAAAVMRLVSRDLSRASRQAVAPLSRAA